MTVGGQKFVQCVCYNLDVFLIGSVVQSFYLPYKKLFEIQMRSNYVDGYCPQTQSSCERRKKQSGKGHHILVVNVDHLESCQLSYRPCFLPTLCTLCISEAFKWK